MLLLHGKLGLMSCMLLAVALLTVSFSQAAVITENFDNNQYNHQIFVVTQSGNGTAVVTNNRLEITVPGNSTGDGKIFPQNSFTGDFDLQCDFTLLTWPANNITQVGIFANIGSTGFQVFRTNNNNGEQYWSILPGGGIAVNTSSSDMAGKVRLKRTGYTVEAFFWNSGTSRWQSLGSVSNSDFGAAATLSMQENIESNSIARQTVKAAFDNIKITTGKLNNPGVALLLLLAN